jgi:alpha-1,6-mannosyltransferase
VTIQLAGLFGKRDRHCPPALSQAPSRPADCGSDALKIVDITEFYSERGGGIRSHLTNRRQFLAEHRHSHIVIAPGPRDEDILGVASETTRVTGSRLVRLAGPPLPYDPTYHLLHRVDKIRRRVRAEKPDVLEAHSPYLATAAVLACGRRAARLTTAFWHSDHLGVYVEPALAKQVGHRTARAATKPLWHGVRMLLAPFDAIFAAGRRQAERLRAAGVARVIHIPFGVDTRTFRPTARCEDWRRRWLGGADDGAALIVGCGRFAMEKRWDVLIEAFGHVCARRRAVLVLFGDGPERTRLERSAPPGVRFAGFEPDRVRLAKALASADILAHASPYETFGIGIAEAIACGLPIVVPDAGGAAEHAASACCETYRSLDPLACAAAIERMLNRNLDARAEALDRAARVVTLEQHFGRVLGAYSELLCELQR